MGVGLCVMEHWKMDQHIIEVTPCLGPTLWGECGVSLEDRPGYKLGSHHTLYPKSPVWRGPQTNTRKPKSAAVILQGYVVESTRGYWWICGTKKSTVQLSSMPATGTNKILFKTASPTQQKHWSGPLLKRTYLKQLSEFLIVPVVELRVLVRYLWPDPRQQWPVTGPEKPWRQVDSEHMDSF